jgi:sarcosine oxidase subunit gamma
MPIAGAGAPLILSERPAGTIATVRAQRGRAGDAARAIGELTGLAVADGPFHAGAAGRGVVGIGPGAWLYLDDAPGADAALAAALSGCAAVFDQSAAYGLLRVEGPMAAALLGKGAFLDFDPSAFAQGAAATTVIAHVDAILWRPDDGFVVAVFRSYAESFWHWIETAAAAMGCRMGRAPAAGGDSDGIG